MIAGHERWGCFGSDGLADRRWDRLVNSAADAKVSSLLARRGHRLIEALPPHVCRVLEEQDEGMRASTAYIRRRIVPLLSRVDVPFLVLKGLALNATVYSDDERPMSDVDFLIHEADVSRMHEALTGLGCTVGPALIQDDYFPRFHYEREYRTPDAPPIKIDLHVRPFRPMRCLATLPTDALWDRPDSFELDGVRLMMPNRLNMLIHLVVHAACHGSSQLLWLCDIVRWVQVYHDEIDWDVFRARVEKWRLTWPVREAMTAAAGLFDDELVLGRAGLISKKSALIDRLAWWQAPRDADHPKTHVLVNALTIPGVRRRWDYLRAVLLPDRSHLEQVYPHRHRGWLAAALLKRFWRGGSDHSAAARP